MLLGTNVPRELGVLTAVRAVPEENDVFDEADAATLLSRTHPTRVSGPASS